MNKNTQELNRMDIYSPKGTKVIFDMPTAGYPYHQELAKKYLEVGKVYTVEFTEVFSCSTTVYLEGFKQGFNSVLFGSLNAKDISELNEN